MPVSIRPAVSGDARRIAEIHVAGWRAAYRGQMPDAFLESLSVDQRAEVRLRDIETPRTPAHRTWVAEDVERIVAFALTGPSRDEGAGADVAELFALYADPARWGTGAGRALTDHVLADLGRRRTREVMLWVLEGNARARRFYQIAGFTPDGGEKQVPFGGVPLREVRYRRSLSDR